jgi:hypothetical protein
MNRFRDTKKTLREMVLTMISTGYVPDLREKAITNSFGVLIAIMMNVFLCFLWFMFGVYLYSETNAYGLKAVMSKPRAYMGITIGTL